MPIYLWTAKDRMGKSVVRELKAATIEESKAILIAEGCSDLELKEDEIMTAAIESCEQKVFGEEVQITAEDRLKHRNQPPVTILRAVAQSLIREKGLYLVLIPVLGYAILRKNLWLGIVPIILILAWLGFLAWLTLPGILYAKLNQAKDWHRWNEVLNFVRKLEFISQNNIVKIPPLELARCRAQAFTGLGRLSEGLALMQMHEHAPGLPSWLYKAHLAGLYDLARQHEKATEYTRAALQETPTPALYLDLANRLLRYQKDTAGGRSALAEAEKGTLTDIAEPFRRRVRGILAYLEGNYDSARLELEAALRMLQKTPHQPFRDGNIAVLKAYLCCVLAKLGDLDGARKCFSDAKEYLVATGEKELLEECKSALK
jgi:tetratricopeptide (TPR) repeat protein